MGKATAGAAAMTAMLATGAAEPVAADPGPERAVVLHLVDNVRIDHGVLREAVQEVTRVYHEAGVRAVWSGGSAWLARPDGAFHVDVVVMSTDKEGGPNQSKDIAGRVFGRASRPTRRAYIFYNPIENHSMLTGSNVARLLGVVIAHEVGHLLLPMSGHSSSGIMRAHWEGRILQVPGFTPDQATRIRAVLTAVGENPPAGS